MAETGAEVPECSAVPIGAAAPLLRCDGISCGGAAQGAGCSEQCVEKFYMGRLESVRCAVNDIVKAIINRANCDNFAIGTENA